MKRYTVHVEITETTRDEPKDTCRMPHTHGNRCVPTTGSTGEKKTGTVINLTTQADNLMQAIRKATAHLMSERDDLTIVHEGDTIGEAFRRDAVENPGKYTVPNAQAPIVRPIKDNPQA